MHARISALAIAATLAMSGSAIAMPGTAMTELALRAGPGPMHPIVGTINANAQIDIAGCTQDGNWCQVTWQGRQGWAYAPYLGMPHQGQVMVVPQARQSMQVPTVTYTEQRAAVPATGGQATGAVGGAIAGALIGGPIGAVIGGLAGAATGTVIDPPPAVRTYVTTNRVDPIYLDGEVVVGAALPPTVRVHNIPDYQYRYAVVNGTTVLVEPNTNKIVYVYR
jgi:uncharacterized protein YraI